MTGRSLFIIICIASLSLLSLPLITSTAFTTYTKISPEIKVIDPVAACKANIIKLTPLGAYPEGYYQVKAAFNYCESLA